MDTLTPGERSRVMAAIRSRDTRPELLVRRHLWLAGWRFRVCDRRIAGTPDIVVPRARALVEIRGCFWHRHGWEWDGRKLVQVAFCPGATSPKSNRAFWNAKFRANVRRDAEHERLWHAEGWNVAVVWDCGLSPARRAATLAWLERTLGRWAAREGNGRPGGKGAARYLDG
jgi:DNA mismatch endonuclease (patch repair protein)